MKQTTITLSVSVSDDSFESRIVIPVDSTKLQRESLTKMWLEQITAAFQMHPSVPKEPTHGT